MIILYDKDEISKSENEAFTSLGIGVLTDATSCVVTEELNGQYELEMEYPITGKLYKEIQNDRFISAKTNDIDTNNQPFRIYRVTRPIGGVVTVYAEHISYMTSKVPIKAINAEDLDGVCTQISQKKLINSKFSFIRYDDPNDPIATKNNVQTSFTTKVPYSMRSLLAGSEGSILDVYGGEFKYDKFKIYLMNRRGKYRDFEIRYSKNMTDLEHELSSEKSYNGMCPYYNSTTTETKVSTSGKYKEIYLSTETTATYHDPDMKLSPEDANGIELHPKEWLSYQAGGGFVDKVVSLSVTNIIATEGDLENHLVRAKYIQPSETGADKANYFFDATYNMAYIDPKCTNEFGKNWLTKDDSANPTYWDPTNMVWNPEGKPIGTGPNDWNPDTHLGLIFRIFTEGDKKYHCYLWKETSTGSGQYAYVEATDADGVNQYLPTLPNVGTVTEEKDNILTYEGDIIYIKEKRAIINPEYASLPWPPYSESSIYQYPSVNFLIEVKEEDQYQYTDDRFVPKKDEPTAGNYIDAYPISGATKYSSGWLSSTSGGSTPLTPVNDQYYKVHYSADSYDFVYWSQSLNSYILNSCLLPETGQIVKVPALEVYIDGYPIEGETEYSATWLSATSGGTTPLDPVDQKGYLVHRSDGKLFYFRWEKDSDKYVQMNDRRYTYNNVEWKTVQNGNSNITTYVKHDTTNDTILTLDLTDKFDDTPKEGSKFQKKLYESAMNYAIDNSIGEIKETIKVSFIKLSSSPEYATLKQLEKVYLGDSVKIIYEESGINVIKQVVKTEYNVLKDSYDSIELGEKSASFVNNAIVEGDDISSLTNDRNFADIVTVTNLVAQKITADYIKAMQADITEATITTLTSDSISAVVVEAQRFEIDQLVAQLLVAEDALIRQQLTVGENLIVNGEINVKSGSIKINGTDHLAKVSAWVNSSGTYHDADWLLASKNSTEALDPGNYAEGTVFEVFNSLDVFQEYAIYVFPSQGSAGGYETQYFDEETLFEVDYCGNVTANSLEINGGSISISAKIVDARVNSSASAQYASDWLERQTSHGTWEVIQPDQYTTYRIATTVDNDTTYTYYQWASDGLGGYAYKEISSPIDTVFEVDNAGNLTANSADIRGKIVATSGDIGGCIIEGVPDEYTVAYIISGADRYTAGWLTDTEGSTTPLTPVNNHKYQVYESSKYYYYNWNGSSYVDMLVGILQVGEASIESLSADKIIGGTISASSILLQDGSSRFEISEDGTAVATSLQLEGGSIHLSAKIVEVFNDDEYTQYSSDWLWTTQEVDGNIQSVKIIPEEGVYYKIQNYTHHVTFGSSGNYRYYLADCLSHSNFIEGSNYYDINDEITYITKYRPSWLVYLYTLYLSDVIKEDGYSLEMYLTESYFTYLEGTNTNGNNFTDTIPANTLYTSPALKYSSLGISGARICFNQSTDLSASIKIKSMNIKTNKDAYFKWDSTQNKYVEASEPNTYFEVDSEGNVTANNVTLTGQIFAASGNMVGITGISTETLNALDLSACNVTISKDYSDPNNPIDSSFSLDCPIDLNGITISNSTVYTPVTNLRDIVYTYEKVEKTINNNTYTDIILRLSLDNHDSNDTGKTNIFFGVINISYTQNGSVHTVQGGINSNVYLDASKGYVDVLLTTVEGGSITNISALHTSYSPTQAYVVTNVGQNNATLLLDCDAVIPSSSRTSYLGNVGNEWEYLYATNATFNQINISNGDINLTSYSSINGNNLSEISNFSLINGMRVEGSTGSFRTLCIRDSNNTVDMLVPTCVTKVTRLGSKGWNSFNLYTDFNSSISTVLYVQYIPHYSVSGRNNYGNCSYEPQVAWDANNTTIYIYNDWSVDIEVSILVIGY